MAALSDCLVEGVEDPQSGAHRRLTSLVVAARTLAKTMALVDPQLVSWWRAVLPNPPVETCSVLHMPRGWAGDLDRVVTCVKCWDHVSKGFAWGCGLLVCQISIAGMNCHCLVRIDHM